MKIGPARPLPNGVVPRPYANLREELIAAINQKQSIRQIDSCHVVAARIGKALSGQDKTDADGIELKATGEGAGRVIPTEADFRRALNFSFFKHETAVFHFAIETPLVHHFALIPWYDERQPNGRGYNMYMAYAVDDGRGGNGGPGAYTVGQYVAKTVGLAKPYQDVWTDGELLVMLKALFTSDAAWSQYFLNGTKSLVNKLTVYKYESIEIYKALKQIRRL